MSRRHTGGFTLIEAAVAIAVVAILSGILVPLVIKNIRDSQLARARNDVQVLAAALVSQLKDTGVRPSQNNGPNLDGTAMADGRTQALWGSGGGAPLTSGGGPVTLPAGNSLVNLLTGASQLPAGNVLFNTAAQAEFSYRGPYLGTDAAAKSDPWGSRYLLLGYNAHGQAGNGPIWVVSAGPDRSLLQDNLQATGTPPIHAGTWLITGTSADDIAVRIN